MLTEKEGCQVLKAVFERRGFVIAENVPFDENGVQFQCDGWDAEARIGYEYMTQEMADHEDLNPEELLKLSEWAGRGETSVFIIDETDIDSPEELAEAATNFIDEVEKIRGRTA